MELGFLSVPGSGSDAYEDPTLKMVENSISGACTNAGNPSSFALDSEIIVTDANNKFEKPIEITRTQIDVKDVKRKKENDDWILRKLLRGPRYFDPPDSSYGNCYNCGEGGHTVTGCTAANRKKPCFLCASLEHNGKQCKQRKECFNCKKGGHFARDCTEKSIKGVEKAKVCLKCGDSGHEMYTCKTVLYSVDDLKEIQCYICKCMGHLCCVDYGEGPSVDSCFRCGQLGHTGSKCTSMSSSASASAYTEAPPSYCYKCGQEGHKSRRCKTSTKKRKRKKAKQSNLQDNTENVGVRSAPQELGEACNKKNKTQHGYSTSSQPARRGGWMDDDDDEDPGVCYRSNKGFHGSSDYTCDFHYED